MVRLTRIYFFITAAICSLTGFGQGNSYDPSHLYPVSELQADFDFLQTTLEKTHPNLYLYTPKKQFDLFLDSLYKFIVKPLSEPEFYNLITLINPKVKDGHTMLLPGEEARNYFNKDAGFFPFYVVVAENRIYVTMNCSADTSIKERAELICINGKDAKEILQYLLARQIRDGDNQTYPNWVLTTYFKEYFGFSFGHPNAFAITYKMGNDTGTKTIAALSKDSIKLYGQLKYPKRNLSSSENQGIFLQVNKPLGVATLSIRSFDNDVLKSVYNQNFDTTIQKIFGQIYDSDVQDLILDLRNNQGGDFIPGKILLSYLLRQPVKYLPDSKEYMSITPRANGFKGHLYVLINGGSFSSTSILSSYLQRTNRGVFIGEETGGNKTIISGDPVDTILPNTKIVVEVSTTRYLITGDHNSGHWIIPDYRAKYTVQDIVTNNDIAKELAMRIILKHKK